MAVKVKPKGVEIDFESFIGDSWEYSMSWLDKDSVEIPLSAYTAILHVKAEKLDATGLVELTHLTGITLTDTKPNISWSADKADILANLVVNTPYFFDLELISAGGISTTIAFGTVVFLQDTSR